MTRAALEVVERDAILMAWYLGLEVLSLDPPAKADFGGVQEVRAFLVTQDIDVPVVLLLALWQDGSLRFAAGAGASFDGAWDRATAEMQECCKSRPRRTEPDVRDRNIAEAARACGPEDHLCHYRKAPVARAAMATLNARGTARIATLRRLWPARPGALALLMDKLAAAGLDLWFADRSLPGVFGAGWLVVRALIPGTVELSWGQPYRRLASPRVQRQLEAGRRLSYWPHPIA